MSQKKKKLPYWEQRAIETEQSINDSAKHVENKVITAYRQAQYYLTKKVRQLLDRSKQRSGLDEVEVRRLLNDSVPIDELVELRRLAKDITNSELQKEAQKRLTALSFKSRITRLEDLKAKSFLVSKQVANVQLDKSTEFYVDTIHEAYKEATSEAIIRKISPDSRIEVWNNADYSSEKNSSLKNSGSGVVIEVWNVEQHRKLSAYKFKELSTQYTRNILHSHWHGSNYSKRIWGDTEALAKRLEELFAVETMTGMSELEMAKAIAHEFDRSISVARRLIRTEANYMANQAKLKAWKDRGIEKYKLLVVLDLRTSNICQKKSNEDKVYLVSEAVVNGEEGTYPPFHPWCRTVAVTYHGERTINGNRVANDPISGETMTISQRATYNEWMNLLKQKYSQEEIERQKKKIQQAFKFSLK